MTEEQKYPWESKEEWVVFVGMMAACGTAFGLFELTAEQIGVIGTLGFALIGMFRMFWSSGKQIVLKKS